MSALTKGIGPTGGAVAPFREDVSAALRALVSAIETNRQEESELLELAIACQAGVDRGSPLCDAHSSRSLAALLSRLNGVYDRSTRTGATLRRTLARAMRAEGATIPAIARIFGVSHQRVSSIL